MTSKTNIQKNVTTAMESVSNLLEQVTQALEESGKVEFPASYRDFDNVVVCGMGGSALPAHIIKAAFPTKMPFTVVENYDLPNWVGNKTLVLLSSYSGDTEETLSCAQQAKEKNCLICGITSGGKLEEFLNINNFPKYIFNPKYNQTKLPRFGIGYGVFGQLGILASLGVFSNTSESEIKRQVKEAINFVGKNIEEISTEASKLAKELKGQITVLFAAGHLEGNAHTFSNQINETSKALSFWVDLPDADHSLIEGFVKHKPSVSTLFIISPNYNPRILERFRITQQLIENDGYETFLYEPKSGALIQEILELLYFTSAVSVFLAIENNVDPMSIPAIEFIKSKLGESPNEKYKKQ